MASKKNITPQKKAKEGNENQKRNVTNEENNPARKREIGSKKKTYYRNKIKKKYKKVIMNIIKK